CRSPLRSRPSRQPFAIRRSPSMPMGTSMRNPNAFETGFRILLLLTAIAPIAHADEKQACGQAYDQTQALRRNGKLQAAREQALTCSRDVCAAFIRADCGNWLTAIDASQPTVVFEIRDAQGRETTAVHISLDGARWLNGLDGQAKPIDP